MKDIAFFTIFSLFLTFKILPAQSPDTLWTKVIGGADTDVGSEILQISSGDYFIVGHTVSFGSGASDVWLLKTDSTGDTIWTRTYGGHRDDIGTSFHQTMDGGFIITGYTNTYGAGYYDVWLIRTDSGGDTLWKKTFGGTWSDYGYDVKELADGGYIIAGSTGSYGAGLMDIFVIRTNGFGDTLWMKTYGGTGQDYGYAIGKTPDAGFIIAGDTESFGTSQRGIYLIKTDASGDTMWTAVYDGPNIDVCRDVKPTVDGGYILAGWTRSFGAGEYDVYLIKTDASGDTLWTRTYGDYLDEECYSVLLLDDGGFLICGFQEPNHHSRVLMIRTDASGNKIWEKTIGHSGGQSAKSVIQTDDDGFILTGWKDDESGNRQDLYIIKLGAEISPIIKIEKAIYPHSPSLYQNYPNPFNPITTIAFDLSKSGKVSLKIFDIIGEEIETLLFDFLLSGSYEYHWDAGKLASGVYLYKLEAEGFLETKKMILMR